MDRGRASLFRVSTEPVAGLLLAAGAGRRYGMPKALVELDGQRLVERAAGVLRGAGCGPVVVVLGAAAGEVRARADLAGCRLVDNPEWASGMGSSLRVGLAALAATAAPAAVVLLVDMPGITPAAVRRIAGAAGATAEGAAGVLAMAGYGQRRGHPVLLGRDHWDAIAAQAAGDAGARSYLRAHPDQVRVVPCQDVADDRDMDVPADASLWVD
jgi:CTP:molybdopterin cytidylyltransferase MocA